MKVKSQLVDAQLEQTATNPTKKSRITYDTDDNLIKYGDGSATKVVVEETATQTLENKSIDADENTITNIENADIKAGAAIEVAKLAALTASRAVVSDGSGVLSASSVTSTELGYMSGVTSAVQTQLDSKASTSALSAHLTDPTAAHAASAISVSPSGNLDASNVQDAVDELQTDVDTRALKTNPVLDGDISGTAILDEDDMVSNSAVKLCTQQSIKAYVDANTGAFGAIQAKTGAYTALTSDGLILCSGAAFTITLYTAVGNAGRQLLIKKTDATLANIITIDGDGTETIDGSTTTTLDTIGETVRIISDGSNWVVLSREIPSIATAYTPTFTGVGTVTSPNIFWRRQGDSILIGGYATSGTVAASTFSMTLPSGLSGDFTKMGTSNVNIIGRSAWAAASANNDYTLIIDTSQPSLIYAGVTDSGSRSPNTTTNGGILFGNTNVMYFETWPIPISGWKG